MESANQGKGWTFNTVSRTYNKMRPGYPDELYQVLFAYAPLNASCGAARPENRLCADGGGIR